VHATADIPAGEECLISYGNLPNSEVIYHILETTVHLCEFAATYLFVYFTLRFVIFFRVCLQPELN